MIIGRQKLLDSGTRCDTSEISIIGLVEESFLPQVLVVFLAMRKHLLVN